ncbi:MAG TPA: hypothetical protein VHE08_00895 [Solirubrobacterales bacterium]|nr:hypothetical protein [Solirubrobacterales bacterium]
MSSLEIIRHAPILSAARGVGLLCDGLGRALLHELLAHGPLTRISLAARLHAGPTRVYECLKAFAAAELIEASTATRAPRHGITASGRALLAVATRVEAWFGRHPGGPLEDSVGWRAFGDLGEAWRTALVEWIVRLGPTESDAARGLPGYAPQRLAELLSARQEAGMVELYCARDGTLRYRLTQWAAQAILPLAALARWEDRFHPPGGASIAVEDAVVGLLAILPPVRLGSKRDALCTLTAEAGQGPTGGRRTGTVWARMRRGRVVGVGEGAPPRPADGWVSGSFEAWMTAVLDGSRRALRLDGRDPAGTATVTELLDGLHAQALDLGG